VNLELHGTYRVLLCSGECLLWEYLGTDSRTVAWWQDASSGRVFSEDSLMYAWQLVGKVS
jgi:hypothetical protein